MEDLPPLILGPHHEGVHGPPDTALRALVPRRASGGRRRQPIRQFGFQCRALESLGPRVSSQQRGHGRTGVASLRLAGPVLTWPSHGSGRPTWPAAAARPLIYQLRAVASSNDTRRRRGPSLCLRAAPSLRPTCREEERVGGPLPRARPRPAPPPPGSRFPVRSRGSAPRRPGAACRSARSGRRCRRARRRAPAAVTSPGSASRTPAPWPTPPAARLHQRLPRVESYGEPKPNRFRWEWPGARDIAHESPQSSM